MLRFSAQGPPIQNGAVIRGCILDKPEPVSDLSEEERALLGEALRALRREHGQAWNAACDVAEAPGGGAHPCVPLPTLLDEATASRERRLAAARLQEIEGNPLDGEDTAMFEMFEREGWPHERRRAHILAGATKLAAG